MLSIRSIPGREIAVSTTRSNGNLAMMLSTMSHLWDTEFKDRVGSSGWWRRQVVHNTLEVEACGSASETVPHCLEGFAADRREGSARLPTAPS